MAKLPTDIKALARVHTESALRVLSSIMNTIDAPPSARVAAAQSLLDRGWGKANQTIEIEGEIISKVIRTPSVEKNIDTWQKQYADQQPEKLN